MIRSANDEAASPKYAHIERERRWLVDPSLRPVIDGLPCVVIEDRYIVGTRLRLRRMIGSERNSALKLTKKYEAGDPLARPIVTAYLTEAEYIVFEKLNALPVTKRRYALDGFSLDIFDGSLASLELAEIEQPDDEGLRRLAAPSWALREVSGDPRYQGGALAANGIPEGD